MNLPLATALRFTNTKLVDVQEAVAGLVKKGTDTKFAGKVKDKGGDFTHLQGVVAFKDVYLVTQSDEFEESGRLLIADRSTQSLVKEMRLPVVKPLPRYFHAGGCQLIGDILAVPSETQDNKSVVAFFNVSDPADIRELDQALRVFNEARDAAAAGITNLTRDGREVWLLAVFDSGTVQLYESPDLAGGVPFAKTFSDKVTEKHHQAFPLITDTANRVFALGVNRTFVGKDILVLYHVDFVQHTITPFPDPKLSDFNFSTVGGASLRWGTCMEIVSDTQLKMHCTSKFYRNGCHFNVFDTAKAARRLVRLTARSDQKRRTVKTPRRTANGRERSSHPGLRKRSSHK